MTYKPSSELPDGAAARCAASGVAYALTACLLLFSGACIWHLFLGRRFLVARNGVDVDLPYMLLGLLASALIVHYAAKALWPTIPGKTLAVKAGISISVMAFVLAVGTLMVATMMTGWL